MRISFIAIFLFFITINVNAQIISRIAGTGTAGYNGDSILATAAKLNYPSGIAIDAKGNLYIADVVNDRIRKINTSGIITTIAGNGTTGAAGDGDSAIKAQFNQPGTVAADNLGNIYIGDYMNHRIRKVDTHGIVTTIAGNGTPGYSGDNGNAVAAQLNYPEGVAADTLGNVYIADATNHRIRKVDKKGIITTYAGDGTEGYSGDKGAATLAKLNYPAGITIDSSGNLFITDANSHVIRKVNKNGIITTIAGNGEGAYYGDGDSAAKAQVFAPWGIATDGTGNIYIADEGNSRIRKIDTSGIIRTIAGTGEFAYGGDGQLATNAKLLTPSGVVLDSRGNVYITDYYSQRVRKITYACTEGHWTGAVSTAWETAANWSCSIVPGINTDVIIDSGTAILSTSTAIKSLSVAAAAKLTVNTAAILTITQ